MARQRSGKTFPAINPATGETICQVAEGDKADIDLAVKAARKALEAGPWKKMDAADRGRLMFKLADLIEKDAEELAALESLNCGKTITDSRGDMQGVVNTLRYYAGWADKIEGRTVPVRGNFLSYTLRQPVGVVGQIIPWNFPLLMLAWKWGPALACGNTIVMKPAEQSPLTALRVAALAQEAGFPDGVINMVPGYGETAGAALVAHPDVDKIAFTGHVDTAKIIQKAAADTLKRTTFELGGKSPNVIFADCRHGRGRRRRLPRHLFPRRPVLHRRQPAVRRGEDSQGIRGHAWPRRRSSAASAIRSTPTPSKGRRFRRSSSTRSCSYVSRPGPGRQAVAGGKRVGDKGLLRRADDFRQRQGRHDDRQGRNLRPGRQRACPSRAWTKSSSGPTDTSYGLAAAIWTKDIDKAHLYAKEVKAGTVWVNCYHVVDTTTPFGGFKMSGQGRENGEAALEHYTETKTVTIKLG